MKRKLIGFLTMVAALGLLAACVGRRAIQDRDHDHDRDRRHPPRHHK